MRLMLYLHSSVIQGSAPHSSNNPSVLYRTPHCGVDVNSTSLTVAQYPILGDLATCSYMYILTCRTMMQSLGTRLKYTEQYCMFNIIATHLGSSTVMPCMHTSQRVNLNLKDYDAKPWHKTEVH